MTTNSPKIEHLPNGLTVIAQELAGVRAAAMCLLLPGGSALDPQGRWGVANLTADVVFRGAGDRDSRALEEEFDRLGVVRSVTVGRQSATFAGATLADNLLNMLGLFADVLRRPHLNEAQFFAARAVVLQEIQALEDDPKSRVMRELKWRHWPEPFGAPPLGTAESVARIEHEDVCRYWQENYRPAGAVLAVAGYFSWDEVLARIRDLFEDWEGSPRPVQPGRRSGARRVHLPQETAQSHLALACDTVPFGHEDYYPILGAVTVLSGGASSRLFTELREKRGLCYEVSASYVSLRQIGSLLGYVGTTPERADVALSLFVEELQRVAEDLSEDELKRAKAGLKSALIMGQESTAARAQMLARDWFFLQRVRTLEEIQRAIDDLTVERVRDSLRRHPFGDFTVVCLGPSAPPTLFSENAPA